MIREATERDIPRIVELGSRSLLDGPYKDKIKDNPQQSAKLALNAIRSLGKILVYELDGDIHGLLGLLITPHYFSGELTATEVIWYVEPEHRTAVNGFFPALDLMQAGEAIAQEFGAKAIGFTAPTEAIGDMYKRFGYRKIEVSYMKELPCQSSQR